MKLEPLQAADPNRYVTSDQLADLLDVATTTPRSWRYRGVGPSYHKVSNLIFYRVGDVQTFIRNSKVER